VKYKIKTEIECHPHNKKAIELHLDKVVILICKKIGLHPDEFPCSRELYMAVKSSDKLDSLVALLQKYDSLFDAADALGVTVAPRYAWLHNLSKSTPTQH
jgi:hypothetical protein